MGKLTIDYQKLHDAFFKYVHVRMVLLGLWGERGSDSRFYTFWNESVHVSHCDYHIWSVGGRQNPRCPFMETCTMRWVWLNFEL